MSKTTAAAKSKAASLAAAGYTAVSVHPVLAARAAKAANDNATARKAVSR